VKIGCILKQSVRRRALVGVIACDSERSGRRGIGQRGGRSRLCLRRSSKRVTRETCKPPPATGPEGMAAIVVSSDFEELAQVLRSSDRAARGKISDQVKGEDLIGTN